VRPAWSTHYGQTGRHALAAEDFPRAAELALPDVGQARQDATMRAWLDGLQGDVFANRPVLTLGLVAACMVTGDTAGVVELLDEIERWIGPDPPASPAAPAAPHPNRLWASQGRGSGRPPQASPFLAPAERRRSRIR
jgi:hypothetical protein